MASNAVGDMSTSADGEDAATSESDDAAQKPHDDDDDTTAKKDDADALTITSPDTLCANDGCNNAVLKDDQGAGLTLTCSSTLYGTGRGKYMYRAHGELGSPATWSCNNGPGGTRAELCSTCAAEVTGATWVCGTCIGVDGDGGPCGLCSSAEPPADSPQCRKCQRRYCADMACSSWSRLDSPVCFLCSDLFNPDCPTVCPHCQLGFESAGTHIDISEPPGTARCEYCGLCAHDTCIALGVVPGSKDHGLPAVCPRCSCREHVCVLCSRPVADLDQGRNSCTNCGRCWCANDCSGGTLPPRRVGTGCTFCHRHPEADVARHPDSSPPGAGAASAVRALTEQRSPGGSGNAAFQMAQLLELGPFQPMLIKTVVETLKARGYNVNCIDWTVVVNNGEGNWGYLDDGAAAVVAALRRRAKSSGPTLESRFYGFYSYHKPTLEAKGAVFPDGHVAVNVARLSEAGFKFGKSPCVPAIPGIVGRVVEMKITDSLGGNYNGSSGFAKAIMNFGSAIPGCTVWGHCGGQQWTDICAHIAAHATIDNVLTERNTGWEAVLKADGRVFAEQGERNAQLAMQAAGDMTDNTLCWMDQHAVGSAVKKGLDNELALRWTNDAGNKRGSDRIPDVFIGTADGAVCHLVGVLTEGTAKLAPAASLTRHIVANTDMSHSKGHHWVSIAVRISEIGGSAVQFPVAADRQIAGITAVGNSEDDRGSDH